MRRSAVALSSQFTEMVTYLPTKMQALGRNSPCAFLPEGASCKRSPRRARLLSNLGGTTVILGGDMYVLSRCVVCLGLCEGECQRTVWTRWLCDGHAEKYEGKKKNSGGRGSLKRRYLITPLVSQVVGLWRTMAAFWGYCQAEAIWS